MATKKKTVKVAPKVVETKEEAKVEAKEVAPKQEVKVWTYEELVLLPREEFVKAEADIKA
jgi:hypothetical protein